MASQRRHSGWIGRRAADRLKVPAGWGSMPSSAGWTFPVAGQALAWHRRLAAGAARLARRSEEFLRRILLGVRIRPASDHGRVKLNPGVDLEFSFGAVPVHDPAVSLGERPGMSNSARFRSTPAGTVDSPTSDGLSTASAPSVVFGRQPVPATGSFAPVVETGRFAGLSAARLFAESLMLPMGSPDVMVDSSAARTGLDLRAAVPASGRFRPAVEPGLFAQWSAAVRFPGSLILQTGPPSLISAPAAVHPEFHPGAGAVGDGEDLDLTLATRKDKEGAGLRQEAAALRVAPTHAVGAETVAAQSLQHSAVRPAAAFAAPGPQPRGPRPASLIEPAPSGLLPAAGARVLAPTSLGVSGLRPPGSAPAVFGQSPVMVLKSREPAGTTGDSNLPVQGAVDPRTPESADVWPDARGSALGVILRTKVERLFPRLDLTAVRVHTDAAADRSARTLGADAFALGRDIFFRVGRFDPASAGGLALLGHELVHVHQFQQQTGPSFFSNQTELERQAAATERTLTAMFATPPLQAASAAIPTGPAPSGGSRGVHAAPIRTPASLPPTAGDGALPSSARSSAPAVTVAARGLQPLTAETGRTEAAAAAAATAGEPEDIEDLSRRLLRIIERRIAVERERRGVDRWAR